jgi:hypothetical protein
MSVFAAGAPQISAMEPRIVESQFRAGNDDQYVRLVSPKSAAAKRRGALTAAIFAL